LADLLAASISLESTLGEGATFMLDLPININPAEADTEETPQSEPSS
jgi:hypothetical protein